MYAASLCASLFDTNILPFRLQLFELCDLSTVPSIIKHRCQETLTQQWTRRLPLLQSAAPSSLAATLLQRVLDNITDINSVPYTLIDFCSGAGGPVPVIEKAVNASRQRRGQTPIQFRLSDIEPNLDAWIEAAGGSEYLSFIPQAVDATNPPPSVRSISSSPSSSSLEKRGKGKDGGAEVAHARTKMIHLFCLSFHHFDDLMAKKVLRNTLTNSDAFVILELQDRSLGCVLMLSMEWLLLFVVSVFWFWSEPAHLALTYAVPVLPFVHTWDGVVSCLRTRTDEELRRLVDAVIVEEKRGLRDGDLGSEIDDWTISSVRQRHTWPFGYMNAFIGIRNDCRRE
ncbi:hypothetical protein MBLNU457_g2538t1 [Dothideomycetes sp. NU457]